MSRRIPRRHDAPAVDGLLRLLTGVPASTVVGFMPCRTRIEMLLSPMPPDARAGAAGLFGMVAPPEWSAVGAVLGGRARRPGSGELVSAAAAVQIVVTRAGRMATELSLDGVSIETDSIRTDSIRTDSIEPKLGDAPQGIVVDALHRMLGLPSPGRPPGLASLVVSIWLDEVVAFSMTGGRLDWADAVALHPGDPGPGTVSPSTETVIEATLRAAEELDWERMRRRAARGEYRAADLTAREASWMDEAMFGRWLISSLPEQDAMLEVLRATGSVEVADAITTVIDAVEFHEDGGDLDDEAIPRSA